MGLLSNCTGHFLFQCFSDKAAVTGIERRSFYGSLYDGGKRVSLLRNGQFATFQLPAGLHSFGGGPSRRKHPDNLDLSIDVQDGQQYFIAVTVDLINAGFLYFQTAHLKAVDCATAKMQAPRAKPVPAKSIDKSYKAIALSMTELPACIP